MTETNLNILIAALEAQLANPRRACVNSETAFARERLDRDGHHTLARKFWFWLCCGRGPAISDARVIDLVNKLDAIDREFTMPAWGTSGT